MEVPVVLLCAAIMLNSCVLSAPNGYGDNGVVSDMAIDESSPGNILVHNTFHITPMDQTQKSNSEMIDDVQFVGPSMTTEPYNIQSHQSSRAMESKIDWLVETISHILNLVQVLEYKNSMNSEKSDDNSENLRASSTPGSTIDFMDSRQIMTALNNIHQFVMGSNGKAKQSDVLEDDQIEVIKKFVSTIENDRRRAGSMYSSTPNTVSEVLSNSRKTLENLENLSGIVHDIDYRVDRLLDKSCRLRQKSNEYRNGECNGDKCMVGSSQIDIRSAESEGRYERTYQNMKRDTDRVIFEPKKYNCHDLQLRRNGIYKFASLDEVSNEAGRFYDERYCDFSTDGVAWTVIQRRFPNDQQENFNRSWWDYKHGFGELDREFWFGNDFIHRLTFDEDVELRIVIEDTAGRKEWVKYKVFRVDSEEYNYNLMIGDHQGSIQNSLRYSNDQEFSTYDRQNDNNDESCAISSGSGWWFNNCTFIANSDYTGMSWENWLGDNLVKSFTMMVRPKGLWGDRDSEEDSRYVFTSSGIDP